MYADTFSTTGEKKLQATVARMVTGPAQTRLGEAELAALVAFHRSIVKDEPFVIVTRIGEKTVDGTTIEGEASIGGTVHVVIDDKEIEAVMDQWKWRAMVPSDAGEVAAGSVRVQQGERKMSCPLKSGASSHDASLPRE